MVIAKVDQAYMSQPGFEVQPDVLFVSAQGGLRQATFSLTATESHPAEIFDCLQQNQRLSVASRNAPTSINTPKPRLCNTPAGCRPELDRGLDR